MKIVATIEARLNSSRLPKKHLLKIKNKYIIELLINRLKKIKNISKIIISTTNNSIDKKLVNIAKKNNIGFYQGSENNVLERVLHSAQKYSSDAIFQVSGDCPLIDYKLADFQISMFKKNKVDIATEYWKNFPAGVCAPVIKTSALKESLKKAKSVEDFEHVTNYIFHNQKKFKILYFLAPDEFFAPNLEFLLDEFEDFKFLQKIMEYDRKNMFQTRELINLCREKKIKNKKNIIRKNKNIKKFINLSK